MLRRIGKKLRSREDRTAVFTMVSVTMNAITGVGKLALGVYMLSAWFIINALYYLLLCGARAQAMKKLAAVRRTESPMEKYRIGFAAGKHTGYFVFLLGLSYLLVCMRMYFAGEADSVGGGVFLSVAAVALSKLALAVWGLVLTRSMTNPVIYALKMLSLMDASVSVVVTEYTLAAVSRPHEAAAISGVFGMAVSIIFMISGAVMALKKPSTDGF